MRLYSRLSIYQKGREWLRRSTPSESLGGQPAIGLFLLGINSYLPNMPRHFIFSDCFACAIRRNPALLTYGACRSR